MWAGCISLGAIKIMAANPYGSVAYGIATSIRSCSCPICYKGKTKNMNKLQELSATLRRLLSPSKQKQYKAGLIRTDLALSKAGRREVWALLQEQFDAQLTERAVEIISDEESK